MRNQRMGSKFAGRMRIGAALVVLIALAAWLAIGRNGVAPAQAQAKKPNIVVIMGDDVGIWNIGAYHRGMMAGRTPNLDRLAKEGMLFTDYYAESSVPAMIRWPGHVPAGTVANGIMSGLDWFPTFVAAAGNPNIKAELLKGKKIGDRTYKNHLDSYNQMDMMTGKGPSARHEIFYFGESTLGAVRIDDWKYRFIDQPGGWLGPKVELNTPRLTNLRVDPFERLGMPENGTLDGGQGFFMQSFVYEFWRFVFVQQEVAKLAQTAIEYPPMQKGASFNLDAVKAKIEAARKAASAN